MSGQVTLEGRLTADPELRYIASGKGVCKFTVVTATRFKNNDTGQWEERDVSFHNCEAWGQMAENIAESLGKGTAVVVKGKLVQRSYETKEGDKRTVWDVKVDDIGPSLRWASAKVNKMERASQRPADKPVDDPWASSGEPPW